MSVTEAVRALDADDLVAAEAILTPLLAERPGDAGVLRLLGVALLRLRRLDEAEQILERYVAASPTADSLSLLGRLQFRRGKIAACEPTLERLVATGGASLDDLRTLAKVKMSAGKHKEVQDLLRNVLARDPENVDIMAAYTDAFANAPDQACVEIEALLPRIAGKYDQMAHLLQRSTQHRARANRIKAGKSLDFAESWEDVCTWADPEGLERLREALLTEAKSATTARPGVFMDLACIALLDRNWAYAESLLAHVRDNVRDQIADCAAFGSAFHTGLESLTDSEILGGMVPVEQVRALVPQTPSTMFLASDCGYFQRFTLQFLKSLEAAGIAADVQVHLLDGTPDGWAAAEQQLGFAKTLRVGLSAEASGGEYQNRKTAKVYYHAVRFIRLYQEIQRTGRPTCLLDADVKLEHDPRPILERIARYDVTVWGYPGFLDPTQKIAAAFVGVAPTALGLEFARRVAAYIAYWKTRNRWNWGVDQRALYSCYARMYELNRVPATYFLGPDAACGAVENRGALRFPGGILKYIYIPEE